MVKPFSLLRFKLEAIVFLLKTLKPPVVLGWPRMGGISGLMYTLAERCEWRARWFDLYLAALPHFVPSGVSMTIDIVLLNDDTIKVVMSSDSET